MSHAQVKEFCNLYYFGHILKVSTKTVKAMHTKSLTCSYTCSRAD